MSERPAGTLQDAPPAGQDDIDALRPWFHNLHLPDGRQTSPHHRLGDFPRYKWEAIAPHLPADLTGWTALDIGCNAGFYTVQLALRGALVRAIDVDGHYLRQARWAVGQFGVADRVEVRQGNVYDLLHEAGSYDLVWFMGVLYHLRHPLLALDLVARATRRLAVVQTLTLPQAGAEPAWDDDVAYEQRHRLAEPGWPSMAFIPGRFAGDATNWWVPNPACLDAMLVSSGLRVVAEPDEETRVCRPEQREPVAMNLLGLVAREEGSEKTRS